MRDSPAESTSGARGTFTLFQKPARQHRRGVFFDPLIEQRGNFLAEIGGVSQTRQLKALQGVLRSGQKEIPGWLGRTVTYCGNLWKTFLALYGEKRRVADGLRLLFCEEGCASQQPLRACSACAGDYENPDRTAWTPDGEEDETTEPERPLDERENQDEFPAQES